MPVTLAQAQVNMANDVDFRVTDNLRRYSWVWDQIVFDDIVTPGTNGGTLTYSYNRLKSPRRAEFRAYNTEYVPQEAEREQVSVNLKPHGGAFNLDRVFRNLGPASTNEITFQMSELEISTTQRWLEELILGDTAVNALGFDGLNKSLTGSTTEYDPLDNGVTVGYLDLTPTGIDSQAKALTILGHFDTWLSSIIPSRQGGGNMMMQEGAVPPGTRAIIGNTKSITRLKTLAKWAGMYQIRVDTLDRTIESYNGWVLHDLGDGQLGSAPIVPVYSADADEGGGGSTITGLTDLYAVSFGIDALHAASPAGIPLVQTWLPDWSTSGAVKTGEVEVGPTALVLKNVKSCGVLRKVKVA